MCDFWDAYNTFELKQTTSITEINGTIRPQVVGALKSAVNSFESIDLMQLRSDAQSFLQDEAYIITLDGGIIFNKYDYSIEITRACTKIADAELGPYIRLPRPLSAQLSQQFINIRSDFEKTRKNQVILSDDGIGTGGTIKRILSGLKNVDIKVNKIVTIANPCNIKEIDGVTTETIYTTYESYNWLNERDLYWGLPRSGLSISENKNFVGLGGIPYTINKKMVISRIGIDPKQAEQFRLACITANMNFWKMLEKFHGRRLTIKDCGRLNFFSKKYDDSSEVLSILDECRRTDILAKMR